MAQVHNVRLSAGRNDMGQEFAIVRYDIQFSKSEQMLKLPFLEWVVLMERDGDLDRFYEPADRNVGIGQIPRENADDYIGQVQLGIVTASANVVSRSHTRAWDFPDNEKGPEEYRALVQVIPEIRTGRAWSNEVSINLE